MVSLGGVTADVVEGPLTSLIDKLNELQDNPQAMKNISKGLTVGTGVLGATAALATVDWIAKTLSGTFKILQGVGSFSKIGAFGGKAVAGGGSAIAGGAIGTTAVALGISAAIGKITGLVIDKTITAGLKVAEKNIEELTEEEKKIQALYDDAKNDTLKKEYGVLLENTREARQEAMEALQKEQDRIAKDYYWILRDIQRSGPLKGVNEWLYKVFMPDVMRMGGLLDAQARALQEQYKYPQMSPEMQLSRDDQLKEEAILNELEAIKLSQAERDKKNRPDITSDRAPFQEAESFFWSPAFANELLRKLDTQNTNITVQVLLDGKEISRHVREITPTGQSSSAHIRQNGINYGMVAE
jgi:hypothetical protein